MADYSLYESLSASPYAPGVKACFVFNALVRATVYGLKYSDAKT